MNNLKDLNNTTNDLLLQYDTKFNDLYNKKVRFDSSITNKEEIIIKENDEIANKENTIFILQYLILLIIFFGIALVLFALGKIDYQKLIIITIILIIIYIIIYYRVQLNNVKQKVKVDMATYISNVIENELPYKCPAKCSATSASTAPTTNLIQGYEQPTLKTDPQLNVWQYGDMPTDLYTTSNFYSNYTNIPNFNATSEEQLVNEPKSAFGTTYPTSTYYKCQWLGGDSNKGDLPNVESNIYSTVPCSYRPNFTETGRYICNKDPNNLQGTSFNNACDDVSSS